MSIALACGCGGRRSGPDAGRRPRDAGSVRGFESSASIPPGEWLVSGLSDEPVALAVAEGPARVVTVLDDADERRVFGESVVAFPRSSGERLRFAVVLDGTPVAVAQDGDELFVSALDGSGRLVRVDDVPPITTMRRAVHGRTLYFAHVGATSPVRLETFELGDDGISHRGRELETATDELSRELVGLAADETGFALLFRRSVPEDDRGGVVLATERGTFPVDALHDLGLLESIERRGDSIVVVGSFEFDRPIAFRLDPRGRMRAHERLAPGARTSLGTVASRANVEVDGLDVVVRIRDASGDAVREHRFSRSDGTLAPAICRDRHGFVVAWTDRRQDGWAVRLVHLANEPR